MGTARNDLLDKTVAYVAEHGLSDRSLRERFQSAACAQSEDIRMALARHGIDQLTLSTADPRLPALVEFLELRRRRPAAANVASTSLDLRI